MIRALIVLVVLLVVSPVHGFVGRSTQLQHGRAVFNIMSTAQSRNSAMLSWLGTLPSQGKVMSGQMSWSNSITENINSTYGAYPALRGFDWFAQSDPTITSDTAAWANSNGIVHMMYHMPNPFASNSAYYDTTQGSWTNLTTDGTTENTYWRVSLDAMANTLSRLQSSGVTVIFRPFHEMNGSWFWWGGSSNANFISAWQYMHNYLTVKSSLKNLIWAYSPNAPSGNLIGKYPGASYVDIVGLDCYNNTTFSYTAEYNTLVAGAPGKLFAVTEFGGCTPEGCSSGGVDVSGLPDTLPSDTIFWMNWESGAYNYFGLDQSNAGTAAIFSNTKVLTRDEMPNL